LFEDGRMTIDAKVENRKAALLTQSVPGEDIHA